MSSEGVMKKFFSYIVFSTLIVLLVPYTITMGMTGVKKDEPVAVIPYDGRVVIVESGGEVSQNLDYSQYLVGMVARNLVSFGDEIWDYPEFIKVNCVVANTLLTANFADEDVISDDFLSEYYISDEELLKLWGDNYSVRMDMIKNALNETKGLVITYNGTPIKPFYHLISNGMTRTFTDGAQYPYLTSVNTNMDLEEKGFLSVKQYTDTDFINIINQQFSDSGLDKNTTSLKENIQIINRDEAGYVTRIQVGNLSMSGDDFMNVFQINSPSFTLTFQDDSLKIITKGIGHGYGISLSHALYMAKQGTGYSDILLNFYENVEIKNCE